MDQILITIRTTLDELLRLRWNELQFGEARNALLLFTVLAGVAIVTLLSNNLSMVDLSRTLSTAVANRMPPE